MDSANHTNRSGFSSATLLFIKTTFYSIIIKEKAFYMHVSTKFLTTPLNFFFSQCCSKYFLHMCVPTSPIFLFLFRRCLLDVRRICTKHFFFFLDNPPKKSEIYMVFVHCKSQFCCHNNALIYCPKQFGVCMLYTFSIQFNSIHTDSRKI